MRAKMYECECKSMCVQACVFESKYMFLSTLCTSVRAFETVSVTVFECVKL